MEKFEIYYWQFFVDKDDNTLKVYDTREGDLIGEIVDFDIDYIKDYTKNMTEQHVYDFISSVIEWY